MPSYLSWGLNSVALKVNPFSPANYSLSQTCQSVHCSQGLGIMFACNYYKKWWPVLAEIFLSLWQNGCWDAEGKPYRGAQYMETGVLINMRSNKYYLTLMFTAQCLIKVANEQLLLLGLAAHSLGFNPDQNIVFNPPYRPLNKFTLPSLGE